MLHSAAGAGFSSRAAQDPRCSKVRPPSHWLRRVRRITLAAARCTCRSLCRCCGHRCAGSPVPMCCRCIAAVRRTLPRRMPSAARGCMLARAPRAAARAIASLADADGTCGTCIASLLHPQLYHSTKRMQGAARQCIRDGTSCSASGAGRRPGAAAGAAATQDEQSKSQRCLPLAGLAQLLLPALHLGAERLCGVRASAQRQRRPQLQRRADCWAQRLRGAPQPTLRAASREADAASDAAR